MATAEEFESDPVSPNKLQPARNFAASYAGEHVAGTEFVIGALFVAWGVSTYDILWGLLLGNLLAVLTWGLVTAPIATDTRLTLYAYLEKIAGPGTIKLYSVVNGILFCVLAGSMITVSASAIRVLFDIPPQVSWYPTDPSFVAVALVVGAVVVTIAMKGFQKVAQFAEICAPWMILMFVAGALASWPILVAATDGVDSVKSFQDFVAVADQHIWVKGDTDIGIWHVAAFAWICNLAMHGSLGDMTLLRFARKSSYGYFSALGMFIGHYMAWICAGIMGAGAALLVKSTISQLDAGEVAYQVLGAAGILAVIIAGWTTSNPTIYRAGLAFQSLNHKWSRIKVTIVTGVATTVIACFPFVFTKLLDFVGIMGLMLAPIGAVIVTEHWLFPRFGLTRYWSSYRKNTTNYAAVATWAVSLVLAFYLVSSGSLHLFFLLVPIWVFATVLYTTLASLMGARLAYSEAAAAEQRESERKMEEKAYLLKQQRAQSQEIAGALGMPLRIARVLAYLSLAVCAVMAVAAFMGSNLEQFKSWLLAPTIVYFVSATYWINGKEKVAAMDQAAYATPAEE
ncbi:MAG: nucleoside transporter [Gammaproteobacteria bacterium]|nr:nucleoside transporter [Gammaproteobacteria bacterium]